MVGPGEIDDELEDEVKSECSEKYGPVKKCVVYELTGKPASEESVRIFVQFMIPEDAAKGKTISERCSPALPALEYVLVTNAFAALAGLHGRFFGGRQVKAAYYDESKFGQMDLTSE